MLVDSKNETLDKLIAAYGGWYDIERDYEYCGRSFDAYGEFHTHGEQYVLTKRAKIWEVDAHDYLFFLLADHVDAEMLEDAVEFMKAEALKKVDPQPNHMQSSLSLVVLADSVDDQARRACAKARFRRNHRFGLRGWTDLRLAVVDVTQRSVVTNSAGKELKETIEANLV